MRPRDQYDLHEPIPAFVPMGLGDKLLVGFLVLTFLYGVGRVIFGLLVSPLS